MSLRTLGFLLLFLAESTDLLAQNSLHTGAHVFPKNSTNYHSEFVFGADSYSSFGNTLAARMTERNASIGLHNFGNHTLYAYDSFGWQVVDTLFEIGPKANVLQLWGDNWYSYVGLLFADSLTVADSLLYIADPWTPQGAVLVWDKQTNSLAESFLIADLQDLRGRPDGNIDALVSANSSSSAVVTYDNQGNQIDSVYIDNIFAGHLDVDYNGDRYISGLVSNYDTVRAGNFTYFPGGAGLSVFAMKVGNDGNGQWMQSSTDMNYALPHILCDQLGFVWLTGDLFSSQIWGTDTLEGSQWVYDFFLVKMNASSGQIMGAWETPNADTLTGDYQLATRQPIARTDSGVVLMLTNRGGVAFDDGNFTLGGSNNISSRGITFLEYHDDYVRGETFGVENGSYIIASAVGTALNGTQGLWGAGLAYTDSINFNVAHLNLDSLSNDILGMLQFAPWWDIDEQPLATFKVYPNPTSDYILFEPAWPEDKSCTIYNTVGHKIFEGNPARWSAKGLQPGMYILRSEEGIALRIFVK